MTLTRAEILAEAGHAFGAAFDPVAARWNVVRFLVPRLADWALIALPGPDGTLQRAAHAHVDPAAAARLADVGDLGVGPERRHAPDALTRVLQSGRPFSVADLGVRPDLAPAPLSAVDARSLLVVPLGRPRQAQGLIVLGAEAPARFGPAEARLAVALALRAGLVFDIAYRCSLMRDQDAPPEAAPTTMRRQRQRAARARRRAELTRQMLG